MDLKNQLFKCNKCMLEDTVKNKSFIIYSDKILDTPITLCKECCVSFEKIRNIDFKEKIINFIQPERSKREDLDCCKRTDKLQEFQKNYESLAKSYEIEQGHDHICDNDCNFIRQLLKESRMRCSEHCGNTVREAQ